MTKHSECTKLLYIDIRSNILSFPPDSFTDDNLGGLHGLIRIVLPVLRHILLIIDLLGRGCRSMTQRTTQLLFNIMGTGRPEVLFAF